MELVPTDAQSEARERAAGEARLRRLIERKKSERRRLIAEMRELSVAMNELRGDARGRLGPLEDELAAHFKRALASAEIGADDRAAIVDLYDDLILSDSLPPPPRPPRPPGEPEAECPCPQCQAEREAARFDDGSADEPRVASAAPAPAPMLRDLYRDLALRFHPDKAETEEARVENEERMREINSAYAAGDLTALEAISREIGFDVAGDGVLEALAEEYSIIKAEVRALRREPLGELVVATRGCKRERSITPLEYFADEVDDTEAMLSSLAGVFRRWQSGVTDTDEFLDELLDSEDDEPSLEHLEAAIAAMREALAGNGEPGRRTRPDRARRQKRKRQKKARRKTQRR